MKYIKNWILIAILIAIGYFLAVIVEWTHQEEPLTFGNIGSVKRYNKEMVNEEGKAFEDKLKSDKDFRESLFFSLDFISIRTGEFQTNAEISARAIDRIAELAELSVKMSKLAVIAANANEASIKMSKKINLIIAGIEDANVVRYQTLSNNAFLSYLLIDRAKQISQEFVETVDSYMAKNKDYDKSLDFARDLWLGYGVNDALYSNDKEMMKYWESKHYLNGEDMSEKLLKKLPAEQLEKIMNGIQFAAVLNKENIKALTSIDRVAIISVTASESIEKKMNEKIQVMARNNNNIDNILQEGILKTHSSFNDPR